MKLLSGRKFSSVFLILTVLIGASCVIGNDVSMFPQRRPLSESTVGGNRSARQKILLVDLSGVLLDNDNRVALGLIEIESTVTKLKAALDQAEDDENIRAVLVRINSPGGSVSASEIIYHELKAFRVRRKIPMYVLMLDLAASGGYYAAMAADRVYAIPTTATGSIGVVVPMINFAGLMNRFGVKDTTVKSGPHKDMLSPFREPTEDDRVIAQSIVDDYYQQFVDRIQGARPGMSREEILKAADGRIYTARQALDLKLIDGIRHIDEVVSELEQVTGGRPLRVITYRNYQKFNDNLYASAETGPAAFQVRPPALYLWQGAMAPGEAFENLGRAVGPVLSR